MRNVILLLFILCIINSEVPAQPYMVTASNYFTDQFFPLSGANGEPLAIGSLIQMIWDSAGDGMDPPSLAPGSIGQPSGDDVLLGFCQVGMFGGATTVGSFILSGTVTNPQGLCYFRAFDAGIPSLGDYYSESLILHEIPAMSNPTLFDIRFPHQMNQTLGGEPVISVELEPQILPIQIPAVGGSFQFTLTIENDSAVVLPADLYLRAIKPNGEIAPLLDRVGIMVPAGGSIVQNLTQLIPAFAPEGNYMYYALVLAHHDSVSDFDSFPFSKLLGGTYISNNSGWNVEGWIEPSGNLTDIPQRFNLSAPYPNPGNAVIRISFALPHNTRVDLKVYNILGDMVSVITDDYFPAGNYMIDWNAEQYASGMYLLKMHTSGFNKCRKILLIK